MRHRGTIDDHERLLWGHKELISPASAQKRRHSSFSRIHSSPASASPNNLIPRRRPRGSEAGKSIHKAAEATQTTPNSSLNQILVNRSSISAGQHITPTSHPHTSRIAVSGPISPLRTDARWRDRHSLEHNSGHQRLVSLRDGASISARSASPAYKPQVARKSASNANRTYRTARKQLTTKAARKSVLIPSSGASSAEDSSDSSDSSVDSTLSTEPRVKGSFRPNGGFSVISRQGSPPSSIGPQGQDTMQPQRMGVESQGAKEDTKKRKSPGSNIISHNTKRPSRSIASHAGAASRSRKPGTATLQTPFRSASSPDAGDDAVPPPQPLVNAFENLFVYPLYFHRIKRLPFLLRNVRASFKAWCRDHDTQSMADTTTSSHVPLIYEYTSSSGDVYTFETRHPRQECPVCSIFGVFSSWKDLQRHVTWDHGEIECEFSFEDGAARISVRLNEHVRAVSDDKTKPAAEPSPIAERALTFLKSLNIHSQKASASNERCISPDGEPTPAEPADIDVASLHITTPASSRQVLPPASPRSRPPTPPPLSDTHGAAHPIVTDPEDPLFRVRPTTYRPTGPHLYDHLSGLPLEAFGRQTWFVLDKEEEIFELVDVLDEDKVLCALWGRWILLNRPFFIGDYVAGVEAFVDEYWLVIHRAAGWGALRAWLMVLVSRRFLKNIELVRVLKRYNALVGKDE